MVKEIVAIKEVIAVITVPEISFSLLCFPMICSLNPLKTCAWLWGAYLEAPKDPRHPPCSLAWPQCCHMCHR